MLAGVERNAAQAIGANPHLAGAASRGARETTEPVVEAEDHGPLGNLIEGGLKKLGDSWIGQGAKYLSDQLDAFGKKVAVVGKGAWLERFNQNRSAEAEAQKEHRDAQLPAAGGERTAERVLVNTPNSFKEAQNTSGEIVAKVTEEGSKLVATEAGLRGAQAVLGIVGEVASGAAKVATGALGRQGESLIARQLETRGYTDIVQIQNASGHGIDIVARNKVGELRFFEVKTSTTGVAGRLSTPQTYTTDFITSRLERAAQAQGQWKNLDPATRRQAANILAEVRGGSSIQGMKVDVMYPAAGSQGPPKLSFSRWRD